MIQLSLPTWELQHFTTKKYESARTRGFDSNPVLRICPHSGPTPAGRPKRFFLLQQFCFFTSSTKCAAHSAFKVRRWEDRISCAEERPKKGLQMPRERGEIRPVPGVKFVFRASEPPPAPQPSLRRPPAQPVRQCVRASVPQLSLSGCVCVCRSRVYILPGGFNYLKMASKTYRPTGFVIRQRLKPPQGMCIPGRQHKFHPVDG